MKIAISYSGGLDSFILYHYAKKTCPNAHIDCMYFDIGQEYNHKEIAALPDFVEIRKVEWIKNDVKLVGKEGSKSGNIIIPGRNAVLGLLLPAIIATQEGTSPDEVWMGALLGETHLKSTDKNFIFTHMMSALLSQVMSTDGVNSANIRVRFPLAEAGMGKFEEVEWALNNGLTKEQLLKTSSCLNGEDNACGRCVVCIRRWGIFGQLGFSEPYNIDPLEVKPNLDMIREMLGGENGLPCHYDSYRRREIMQYVYQLVGTDHQETVMDWIEKKAKRVKRLER